MARTQYQDLPLPTSYEELPVAHNILVVWKTVQTYFTPRVGKSFQLFGDTGMFFNLWKHVAPT